MKENEVLARFMGYELVDTFRSVDGSEKNLYKHPNAIYPYWGPSYPEQMGFHDRWNWLMPVWYKFRDLHKGINTQVLLDIHKDYRKEIGNTILNSWDSSEGCAEACKLLAQAIEWYNANKQL